MNPNTRPVDPGPDPAPDHPEVTPDTVIADPWADDRREGAAEEDDR